jgi:hypothetical protein
MPAPRIPNAPGRSASSSNASVTIARAETPIRQVALLVDPSCLRRVHSELARQLSECGIRTTAIRSRSHHPLPWSARLLLELERVTRRIAGTRLTDEIDFAQLMLTDVCPTDPPDLVIDLCEDRATRPDGRTVRVLYDGAPGETALMGALLAGRMPAIDLEEVETRAILACGIPCADNAGTILGGLRVRAGAGGHAAVVRHAQPGTARLGATIGALHSDALSRCVRGQGDRPIDRSAPLCIVLLYAALAHLLALRGRAGPLANRNPGRHRVARHSGSGLLLLRRSISVRAPRTELRLCRGLGPSSQQGGDLGGAVRRERPERTGPTGAGGTLAPVLSCF